VKAAFRYHRSILIISVITLSVFLFTTCINSEKKNEAPPVTSKISREQFAGSESCAGCHKDIYSKHLNTAHHLTSRIAT
jgi:hypothetical protein